MVWNARSRTLSALEEIDRSSPEEKTGAARGLREVAAVAAAVVAFVALLWLVRGELGMVWDEPPDIERADEIRDWLGRLFARRPDGPPPFSRLGLERGWRFTGPAPHEHPPLYAVLSLVTHEGAGWLIGPLRAYRLSTVILFGVAAGVLFRLVRRRWGGLPAAAALGGLVFNPRLFADAQLVTLDAVVGCFWFLSAVAFLRGCETGRHPWRFGVLLGLAVMSKATGVLAVPALVLWAAACRPRGALRQLGWAVPITPAVMVAVHPGWWTNPVAGIGRWVSALLDYQQKVPVYYLGHVYDPKLSSLPWHNTVVLTATMVPPGLLLLAGLAAAVAAWQTIRRRARPAENGDRASEFLPDRAVVGWAIMPFAVLMVLRAFAFMPAHDGLRQLAPAFFFFPVLVGYGARALVSSGGRLWLTRGVVLACVGSAAYETLAIHPYELAYYNVLIGGPRGAKAAGMETTYYWDAANNEVLDWMNRDLPVETTVLIFPPPDVRTFEWLQHHGMLRRDLRFLNFKAPDHYVLIEGQRSCVFLFLMRQGLYMPYGRRAVGMFPILAEGPAMYELAPRRVGVRLLAVFNRKQFNAAHRAALP